MIMKEEIITGGDTLPLSSEPGFLPKPLEAMYQKGFSDAREELKKQIEGKKQPDGKVKFVAGTLTNISGNTFYNSALSDVLSMLDGEKK